MSRCCATRRSSSPDLPVRSPSPWRSTWRLDNEVWGIARFSEAGSARAGRRPRGDDPGHRPRRRRLRRPARRLHLRAAPGHLPDRGSRLRPRARESTPRAPACSLAHCRKAKAMLVTSTFSVYKPNPDPWHHFARDRSARRRQPAALTDVLDLEDRAGGRRPHGGAHARSARDDRARERVVRTERRAARVPPRLDARRVRRSRCAHRARRPTARSRRTT